MLLYFDFRAIFEVFISDKSFNMNPLHYKLLISSRKSIALVLLSMPLPENGVAMFRDAVTERGRKRMGKLSGLRDSGFGAEVLFVRQRTDIRIFMPHWERDPEFAASLLRANSLRVKVWVIAWDVRSSEINFKISIPYNI